MNTRSTEFLRGANGGIEVNRLVGFMGGLAVIVGSLGFQGWDMWRGEAFRVSDFCLSLAGAVSLLTGGTGVAVALKDRQVAMAKVIDRTNSVPVRPSAGSRAPLTTPKKHRRRAIRETEPAEHITNNHPLGRGATRDARPLRRGAEMNPQEGEI